MAIAVQMDYTVDLCKPVHLIQMDVPFFTGDKNAHRFHVKLMRDGCDVDTTGMTATGCMVRADNQTVIWDGEVDGCDIYLTMPASCYAVAGRFRLLLKVELDEIKETALWVEGFVTNSSTDTIVDPGTTLWSIEEVLAKLDKLEREMGEMSDLDVDDVDGAVSRTEFDALVSGLPVLIGSEEGTIITLTDSAEGRIVDLKLYGKTTQDGTPSPAVSIPLVNAGAGGSIGIRACGKNTFDASPDGVQCIGGAYVNDPNYDYAITDNDTCWSYRVAVHGYQTYVISTSAPEMLGNVRYEDSAQNLVGGMSWSNLKNKSFVVPAQAKYMVLSIEKTLVDQYTYQIEVGSVATAFEPYKDGGSLTASTPNGLAGLPFDGYAPDLIDFGAGLMVQNVQRIVLDGDEDITFDEDAFNVANALNSGGKAYMHGLCNAYPVATNYGEFVSGDFSVCNWSNDALRIRHGGSTDVEAFRAWLAAYPVTLYFPLPNAIVTPIPEDELAAFRTMRTFKPTSTIYNDADASMRIDYVADTKNYIDQRISAMLKV